MGMRKSRLSWHKQCRLMEHFIAGTTARTAASLCGVNRKTGGYFYHRLREVIAYETDAESERMFGGEVEVDESYFGGRRKGKRGRGAGGSSLALFTFSRPDADGAIARQTTAPARRSTIASTAGPTSGSGLIWLRHWQAPVR